MALTLGTPQYMSPEQALGQLDRIGPHSDVYSLGATLYCILTGRAPLSEVNDVGEVLRRVAQGEIPSARASRPSVPDDTRCDLPEGDGGATRGSLCLGLGPGRRHRKLAGGRARAGSHRVAAAAARALGAPAPRRSFA